MARRSAPFFLAVYDVSDGRERGRIAKVLEALGNRVQESVFELRLSRRQLARLRQQLLALDLRSGFVLLYRMDATVSRESVGVLPFDPQSEGFHAVVL